MSTTMKKILYVITKSNWGGAQKYVFDMATALSKDEFDVTVALGGTGKKNATVGTLGDRLKEKNIRTIFVDSFMRDISVFKEFGALNELIKIFRREKPDIVHLNSSKAGGIGALAGRLARVPKIIFTIHGLPYNEDRNILWRVGAFVGTWLTYILCHVIITVTENDWRRMTGSYFIYNGISSMSFGTGEKIRSAFPNGTLVVGTIGELNKNKNLDLLIEQVKNYPQLYIAIVGDGEKREALEVKIQKYNLKNRVKFFGFIPAKEALPGFDIFVLPSKKEGLPYVLLEAGLAKLPVVATNVGGIPEIIENEKSGILIDLKKPSELASAMMRLTNNREEREKFGLALNNLVYKKFSFEQMVAKTENLYQ